MRENCTYGSMRGSRRKTAKSVLRVVEDRAGVPCGGVPLYSTPQVFYCGNLLWQSSPFLSQAAIDLVNGIYDVIYGLDVMPKRNPVWPREPWRSREIRWTAYKNYNIFYTVDDAAAIVKILRVFYNRRNV